MHPYWRHALAGGFLDCALVMGFTAAPFYIFSQLAGGPEMSGTVAAVQSLCYAMACLASSVFVARVRNGLALAVLGTGIYTLGFAFSPLVKDPYFFAATTVCGMLGLSIVWPAMQAWLGTEPNLRERSKRMAIYNISWSIGLAVGPLIAGPLFDVNYWLPFLGLSLFSISALFLIRSLPSEAGIGLLADDIPDAIARGRFDAASERYLYMAWLANATGWALVGVTRAILPKRIEELVNAGQLVLMTDAWPVVVFTDRPATAFAWLAFAVSAARAVTFLAMGASHAWQHRFSLLVVSQAMSAAALWLLGVSNSLTVLALCCGVIGINGGLCFFASIYYSVANRAHSHRRAAIHETTVGFGSFMGSMSFGYLAGRFGTAWPFVHGWTALVLIVGMQWALLGYGSYRAQRTEERAKG